MNNLPKIGPNSLLLPPGVGVIDAPEVSISTLPPLATPHPTEYRDGTPLVTLRSIVDITRASRPPTTSFFRRSQPPVHGQIVRQILSALDHLDANMVNGIFCLKTNRIVLGRNDRPPELAVTALAPSFLGLHVQHESGPPNVKYADNHGPLDPEHPTEKGLLAYLAVQANSVWVVS